MTVKVLVDSSAEAQMALAQWALKRLPNEEIDGVEGLGPFQAFGVVRDNKPVCVVIWNSYRPMSAGADCRVIIAADDPRWCLPGVLRELFSYPFNHLGCTRITAVIKDGNAKSLKLCRGLGFKKEGVLRRAHNGKTNAIVLSMLREECTWLEPHSQRAKHGQKKRTSPAKTARSRKDHRGPVRREQGSLAGVGAY